MKHALPYRVWSDTELDSLRLQYGRTAAKDIVHLFPGRTEKSLVWKARSLKLPINRSLTATRYRVGFRKFSCDYDYFSEINPHSCYWAGFIAADGHLSRISTPKISITLARKDILHLKRFSRSINHSGIVKEIMSVSDGLRYESCSLSLSVRERTLNDLENIFSVTPKKSLTLQPPKLSEDIHVAPFIVGYIDGDGCIRKGNRNQVPILKLIGTKDVLGWIKKHFDRWVPPHRRDSNVNLGKDGYYRYSVAGKRFVEISDILLLCSPWHLPRKWNVISDFKWGFKCTDLEYGTVPANLNFKGDPRG